MPKILLTENSSKDHTLQRHALADVCKTDILIKISED